MRPLVHILTVRVGTRVRSIMAYSHSRAAAERETARRFQFQKRTSSRESLRQHTNSAITFHPFTLYYSAFSLEMAVNRHCVHQRFPPSFSWSVQVSSRLYESPPRRTRKPNLRVSRDLGQMVFADSTRTPNRIEQRSKGTQFREAARAFRFRRE